eukprot:3176671-Alexandrium_andersonii.AAC.1
MSASLVGSEMCIRDRELPTSQDSRAVPQRPSRASRVPGWDTSGGRAAVSYTHLTLPTICSV